MSEPTPLYLQCSHGTVFGPDTPADACGECNRIMLAAHVGLYGDERPRQRVRVTIGLVGAGEPGSVFEFSSPDYQQTDESLATLLETLARVLRAPSRTLTDGDVL